MLMEWPVTLEDSESPLVAESVITIMISSIESIVKVPIDNVCELHTVGGEVFDVNMGYDKAVKYWHDAIETNNGLFLTRCKREPNHNLN